MGSFNAVEWCDNGILIENYGRSCSIVRTAWLTFANVFASICKSLLLAKVGRSDFDFPCSCLLLILGLPSGTCQISVSRPSEPLLEMIEKSCALTPLKHSKTVRNDPKYMRFDQKQVIQLLKRAYTDQRIVFEQELDSRTSKTS